MSPVISIPVVTPGEPQIDKVGQELRRLIHYNGLKINKVDIRDDCVEIQLERDDKFYTITCGRINLIDSDGKIIDTSVPNWSSNVGISGTYTSVTGSIISYPEIIIKEEKNGV